jgi:ribosomal protein S12 methylthiotransferase
MKAHIVSLGCPKNLTDTEAIMGKLAHEGYSFTNEPSQAELILVNTCAFIKSARDEAQEVIQEMAQWKKKGKCKKLYVAGCYPKWKFSAPLFKDVDRIINSIKLYNCNTPRIKVTHPWFAYVKIAEGCSNRCSYCTVPLIRGPLRIRPIKDILKEVSLLAKAGVKEIIYVAQDTTAHPNFPDLLLKTAKIKGIRWIRVLYAHPAHVTDKLIEVMATQQKIVKYLDLPIQHACDKILAKMNRRYTRQDLENLISKIRSRNIALRTSVIVGFPGEGEAEFGELLDFIRKVKFDKLGVFTYSKEEGTPASKMRGRGSGNRFHKLMRVQARISKGLNNKLIGKTLDVIIERMVRGGFLGRSYMDAPDIDGSVFVKSSKFLKPGKIVKVRVTSAKTYDLIGCLT